MKISKLEMNVILLSLLIACINFSLTLVFIPLAQKSFSLEYNILIFSVLFIVNLSIIYTYRISIKIVNDLSNIAERAENIGDNIKQIDESLKEFNNSIREIEEESHKNDLEDN